MVFAVFDLLLLTLSINCCFFYIFICGIIITKTDSVVRLMAPTKALINLFDTSE